MENAIVDYSGTDVTVDAFVRVLLGRPLPGEGGKGGGRSLPRLDERTNVLVYLTGHGGDNFFKFQDGEELMSNDVASVFSQMYELKKYHEVLFIADTCQAFTMAGEPSWFFFSRHSHISLLTLHRSLLPPHTATLVLDNRQMRFGCQMCLVLDQASKIRIHMLPIAIPTSVRA